MNLPERRRLADANLIHAFQLAQERLDDPSGGAARFGTVEAIACGVNIAFYNPVLAFRRGARPDDVLAAMAWVEARELPASIQVRDDIDPELRHAIEGAGFVGDPVWTPALVLDPIPDAPTSAPDVSIRFGGADLFDDVHAALESGPVFRRVFGPAFLADSDVVTAVAYLDGEPVSAATAIRARGTLGIYGVGTQERARRRGIGGAVTWAAIAAGRTRWGSVVAILQSSEMGLSLYRSMGFEDVGRYVAYERPKAELG